MARRPTLEVPISFAFEQPMVWREIRAAIEASQQLTTDELKKVAASNNRVYLKRRDVRGAILGKMQEKGVLE